MKDRKRMKKQKERAAKVQAKRDAARAARPPGPVMAGPGRANYHKLLQARQAGVGR